jgi:hypothetical protein
MYKILMGASVTALMASGASAQELSYGTFTASYGALSGGGTDVETTLFAGQAGMQMGNVDFWTSGYVAQASIDGLPVDLGSDALALGFGYTFAQDFRVDVSTSTIGLDIGGVGLDIGLTEIGAAYDNGTYFGRLSYTDLDLPGGIPIDSLVSLHAGYAMNDVFEVSLSVHAADDPSGTLDPIYILTTEYDNGQFGVTFDAAQVALGGTDLSVTTLGGNYQINDQWGVEGAYTVADAGGGLDATQFRLGATYDFNDNMSAFANYNSIEIAGTDVDGFSLGMTVDFGTKSTSQQTTGDRLAGVLGSVGGFNF